MICLMLVVAALLVPVGVLISVIVDLLPDPPLFIMTRREYEYWRRVADDLNAREDGGAE